MRDVTSKLGNRMFIFDSVAESVAYTMPNVYGEAARDNGAAWVGRDIPTWKLGTDAVNSDWKYGLETLGKFVQRLQNTKLPEIKSHVRRSRFNEDDGDEICLDRLRAGQAFWRRSEREETSGPTEVTIIIDTTTHGGRESTDALWRGAAALALASLLEEKGYRVEIWVIHGSCLFGTHRPPVLNAACLKRTSDPLDVSTLVNTVSGWYYRTFSFALWDSICKRHNNGFVETGYGMCYSPVEVDLDEISHDQNRFYIAGVFSFSAALALIEAQLEKLCHHENA